MRERVMPAPALLLALLFFLCVADPAAADGSMRFQMVRTRGPDERLDMRGVIERDVARYQGFAKRARRKALGLLGETETETETETFTPSQLRMIAGADYDSGEYVVELKVGSPPKKFRLVADTGSELTWMNCFFDFNRPRRRRPRVFLPANSSTFTPITCSSFACKTELAKLGSLRICPTPFAPCQYNVSYIDGSYALGMFGRETVTADLPDGGELKLDQVLIGCSQSAHGTLWGKLDGVLGLGNSERSITSLSGGVFSYCLVDHFSFGNVTGYLTLGKSQTHSAPLLADMRYTNLVPGMTVGSAYGLDVSGISIGGQMLKIPMEVWDPSYGGGMVVDSGTTLTILAEPAYQLVMEALEPSVSRYTRLHDDFQSLQYCFDATGFDETQIPPLAIVFKDGTRFVPPVKSYVIDYTATIKCLGFIPTAPPNQSLLGNIMQQEHLWEFDVTNGKIGFAPSLCEV